jgi:hypothetical protein
MPERLKPLGTAEIVDRAFALYRQSLGLFFAMAAIVYVPCGLLSAHLVRSAQDTRWTSGDPVDLVSPVSSAATSLLLYALAAGLVQGSLGAAVTDRYLGLPVDFSTACGRVFRRIVPLLATLTLSAAAVAAGFCACGLPGIALAIGLAFAPQIVVIEKVSATQALTRAWHLSRADRVRMLGVILLVFIVVLSTRTTASLVAHWLFRSEGAADLLTQLATVPAYPLVHIALAVLYIDSRVRKEGFDLAVLAAQIATEGRSLALVPLAGDTGAPGAGEARSPSRTQPRR